MKPTPRKTGAATRLRATADDAAQAASGALPLASNLGYRISYLGFLLNRAITPVLAAHGISNQQWRVLSVLSEMAPVTAQEVTGWATLDKSAVSRTVRQLLDAGLLRRKLHGEDARNVHLFLTAKGSAVHQRVAAEVKAMQAELLRDVSPAAAASLFKVLRQVEEGLAARLEGSALATAGDEPDTEAA